MECHCNYKIIWLVPPEFLGLIVSNKAFYQTQKIHDYWQINQDLSQGYFGCLRHFLSDDHHICCICHNDRCDWGNPFTKVEILERNNQTNNCKYHQREANSQQRNTWIPVKGDFEVSISKGHYFSLLFFLNILNDFLSFLVSWIINFITVKTAAHLGAPFFILFDYMITGCLICVAGFEFSWG